MKLGAISTPAVPLDVDLGEDSRAYVYRDTLIVVTDLHPYPDWNAKWQIEVTAHWVPAASALDGWGKPYTPSAPHTRLVRMSVDEPVDWAMDLIDEKLAYPPEPLFPSQLVEALQRRFLAGVDEGA